MSPKNAEKLKENSTHKLTSGSITKAAMRPWECESILQM